MALSGDTVTYAKAVQEIKDYLMIHDKLKDSLIKYLRHVAQLEFSQSVIVRVNSWIVCWVAAEKSDPRIHTNKTSRHVAAIHDKLKFVGHS